MIDRHFTAALTFAMLSIGAGSLFSLATDSASTTAAAAPRQVQLERVVITAKRVAPQVVAQADAAAVSVQ